MSNIISITNEIRETIRREFEEVLDNLKLSDGKISYTKTFTSTSSKATLFFSEVAWVKMQSLVREFSSEIAWHGLATRGDDESKNEYYIHDIIVYPQQVSGATVTTDQEEYTNWLYSFDDEQFNNIRMQGHSHVNMGTTPSSVDTALYDSILEQLEGDMFYIFLIWNKRQEKTIKIYDLKKNIMFDTSDVTVIVKNGTLNIADFLGSAKEMAKPKPAAVTPAKTSTPAQKTSNYSAYYDDDDDYSGYGGYNYNGYGGYYGGYSGGSYGGYGGNSYGGSYGASSYGKSSSFASTASSSSSSKSDKDEPVKKKKCKRKKSQKCGF